MDKYLYKNLCELTVQEVLNILIRDFEAGTTRIMFKGTHRIVSLIDLSKEYAKIGGVLAIHISPISFRGGPPGVESYYDGTLLTLLCDKVLTAWCLYGNYDDLVESEVACC